MTDLKAIRKWAPERWCSRLGELHAALDREPPPENIHALEGKVATLVDEIVLILLEVLKKVVEEKGWEFSALELFEGVYCEEGMGWEVIRERFRETRVLIARFTGGSKREKQRIRPQLAARGMI